jgi:signal transduction histidine kinase
MVDIDLQLAADLLPLKADPVQIEQMLINLATNAVDAMDNRGQLIIRTENFHAASDLPNNYLEIQLGDYVRLSTLWHIFDDVFSSCSSCPSW